jgi:hypothetical protein
MSPWAGTIYGSRSRGSMTVVTYSSRRVGVRAACIRSVTTRRTHSLRSKVLIFFKGDQRANQVVSVLDPDGNNRNSGPTP